MILRRGQIHTLGADEAPRSELSIVGDRIVPPGAGGGEWVDLGGLCVVPGFSDAHVHFPTWSLAQRSVRFEDCRSLADARTSAARGARPARRRLASRLRLARRRLARRRSEPELLDGSPRACRWRCARRTATPSGSAPAALARAEQLEVDGGVVERDAGGRPTGILREEAAWRFYEQHARPSVEEYVSAMRDGVALANSRGTTAVHDKDGGLGATGMWQRLREQGGLSLRVWQSLPHDVLPELEWVGLRPGLGDDLLRVGYLKVFMDGALGSQTARLLDGSGVEITTQEELAEIVLRAARAGWPVAVHAIGDAANRAALNAFEETRHEWQPRGLRQRIEHAQLLDEADVGRFAALGVAASVQYSHAPSDRDLVESIWGERGAGAYRFRTLLDSGAVVANGSDAPIEDLDPLLGVRSAVHRSLDERPPWRPEQASRRARRSRPAP